MNNVYISWNFYERLGEIISNLPKDEVISYQLSGRVNELPTLTTEQYITDSDGKVVIHNDSLQEETIEYAVIPMDEYMRLKGNV
jgi:hypothetical protein